MLALLGTAAGRWLAGGLAALLLLGGVAIVILTLRAERDEARAGLATATATVNELQAANAANLKTIDEMRAADAEAEHALTSDATQQQAVQRTVAQIEEHVAHVPVPSVSCRSLDARDRAAVAGLRELLAPAAGRPGPDGQDAAAGGSDGGHSAAGRP
jgi:hypothetical protein